MDCNKMPNHVYSAVYQNLGGNFDEDDDIVADKITVRIERLSNKELFDRYLTWNGIIGFTDSIIDAYENIFKKEEK